MTEKLVTNLQDQLIAVPARQLQYHINLVSGVENEVANLSSKLKMIERRLRAVERRRLTNKDVGDWHDKLQDLAYEMDDVLDEWNTEIHKYRVEVAEVYASSSTFWDEVRSFLLTYCLCYREVSIRRDIAGKIKELNRRMNSIYKEWEDFKFEESSTQPQEFQRLPSTSDFDESELQGREEDKKKLVEQLLSKNEDNNNNVRILSIVGMGGIGKTTLAQVLFNDHEVNSKDSFELRKWVCVSDPFDQKRIAKAILEDTGKGSSDASELETLVQRIKKLVSGKKFLLVLDDVWTEDSGMWKPIWNSLKHGAPGSKILVTTRNQRVAEVIGTDYRHQLSQLDDSYCCNILSRVALSRRSEKEREKFTEICFKISRKCQGLPLAARILGSLLQFKDFVKQWEDVLNSKIWELQEIWELKEESKSLFPHLYLSYNELSPEMKRCFSYCAVFPKDFEINVQELIRLWMAQGYLSCDGRSGELESWGYECFSNLAMHSFFQNLKTDVYDEARIVSCKMHDIIHDFAKYLTKGECLVIDDEESINKAKNLLSCSRKVRHLRWSLYLRNVAISSVIADVGKLRSFYIFGHNAPRDLFQSLKRVRVLSLCGINLDEVPRAIGNLIHLHLLDLSWNPLKVLPSEICNLCNLETLNVSYCRELTQLPQGIGKLINLRHLLNFKTNSLKQLSAELEKLTSLRTLREFKVGNEYDKFEYLKNLNQLGAGGGRIWIQFHEINEVDFDATTLRDKICIRELTWVFIGEETNYASLLEPLQAPPNLESLHLFLYPNPKLPSWITSVSNLRTLVITSDCPHLEAHYRKDGGEDWIHISHIPNVVINACCAWRFDWVNLAGPKGGIQVMIYYNALSFACCRFHIFSFFF